MQSVTILDTAVASTNLGDYIIMDAAQRHLSELFDDAFMYRVASHEWMGGKSRSLLRRSQASITCGTNLLSSRMWLKPLWKLSPRDALARLNVTLLGAGWYQHQSKPDSYTRWLLRSVLSGDTIHSVRDDYSRTRLEQAGIGNVLNTGCPTLWQLTPALCSTIPAHRGSSVVTTVNTYIKNAELDQALLQLLNKEYQEVYFWVQTATDLPYVQALAQQINVKINVLKPSLQALDELLASRADIDYVGNRLHAGIRAMQHGRRSIIIEVDNRALEMGKDFNLPTIERDDIDGLQGMIAGDFATEVRLPTDAIERWKQQFRPANAEK